MNEMDYLMYHRVFPPPFNDIQDTCNDSLEVSTFSPTLELSRLSESHPYRYLMEPYCPRIKTDAFSPMSMIGHTFPDTPSEAKRFMSPDFYSWNLSRSSCSPSDGSPDASYIDSGISDCQGTPWSSPGMSPGAISLQSACLDGVDYSYASPPLPRKQEPVGRESCVTMQDLQKCADEPMDEKASSYDDGPATYGYVYGTDAQEGYQPIGLEEEAVQPPNPVPATRDQPSGRVTQQALPPPVTRRGQSQNDHRMPSPAASSRITKTRSTSSKRRSPPKDNSRAVQSPSGRDFVCPLTNYGCSSVQSSKNEWKRHIQTQHMRLGYWQCDECDSTSARKFNRKDLFIQHVRRMHAELLAPGHPQPSSPANGQYSTASSVRDTAAEEQILGPLSNRCYHHVRSPPSESGCLFCPDKFSGPGSWDNRLEHVGRHMETAKRDGAIGSMNPANWRVDKALDNWMLLHGILVHRGKTLRLGLNRVS